MNKGIDISYFQGNIDFKKVKADGIDLLWLLELRSLVSITSHMLSMRRMLAQKHRKPSSMLNQLVSQLQQLYSSTLSMIQLIMLRRMV